MNTHANESAQTHTQHSTQPSHAKQHTHTNKHASHVGKLTHNRNVTTKEKWLQENFTSKKGHMEMKHCKFISHTKKDNKEISKPAHEPQKKNTAKAHHSKQKKN
jgi:hypothetical protein